MTAVDYKGRAFNFGSLAQKVTVVVNVSEPKKASHATPQNITHLKELDALHSEYRDGKFEILAFPCSQVSRTCRPDGVAWCEKMGFSFPIMQNVDVDDLEEHPVYRLLNQDGPSIRCHVHTSFVVACNGDRCQVYRFDGLPPRALRSRIDELLSELSGNALQVDLVNA